MESDARLTDYIDKSILQTMQDTFSDMTGFAALITDADGTPVTEGSGFCRFCNELSRKSPLGKQLCEYSDKNGGANALMAGKTVCYKCHAGLAEFASPIILNDEMIGCFVGGQMLTEEPDEKRSRSHALQIGANPDEYVAALNEVKTCSEDKLEKAMDFLGCLSGFLSEMARSRYNNDEANARLQHAARMKSDFLANMSHEIRTPMNAVIGMAEMALRENLSDSARRYISQIKSSGRALLTIIDDILDFSRIESGRMNISPVEYDPISLFNDVAGVTMTRLIDRNVELILNLNVDMPRLLCGDCVRIRQVLINLANNAVKFTDSGQVRFVVDFSRIDDEYIMLNVSVEDTGIGIKPENLEKIFESFSQAESGRNRSSDGTGLGLAISKQLLNLMNGKLSAESEYKRGSVFSFKLPQKVVEAAPAMRVNDPDKALVIGMFGNEYVADGFTWDAAKLGVSVMNLDPDADLELAIDTVKKRNPDRNLFVFIDQDLFDKEKLEFIEKNPDLTAVMVSGFFSDAESGPANLLIARKPLSAMSLTMIINHGNTGYDDASEKAEVMSYTAPDAKVLIVEDHPVNLQVTKGLLEPLEMDVQTASSGKEAIRKIEEDHYDLILMDHMMPEMDGVETTRIIRRMYPDYADVPIIALTANAVNGVKDVFLGEGMNDFLAKPVDLRNLATVVKKWLPEEKVVRDYDD